MNISHIIHHVMHESAANLGWFSTSLLGEPRNKTRIFQPLGFMVCMYISRTEPGTIKCLFRSTIQCVIIINIILLFMARDGVPYYISMLMVDGGGGSTRVIDRTVLP